MRTTFVATTLAAVASVSGRALPQQAPGGDLATALPITTYKELPHLVKPIPLEVAAAKYKNATGHVLDEVKNVIGDVLSKTLDLTTRGEMNLARDDVIQARGSCQNPRVRVEWDYMADGDKQNFVSAIQCLMNRPSQMTWANSRSRYEDFVALHQHLTPNVHGNAKFLIWHRYFLWTFEDVLRSECGFSSAFPWWDETRYAGNFCGSSVFSSQWFGTCNAGNGCVTDGQFGSLTMDVGPGTYDQLNPHCLQRQTDESATSNVNSAYVAQCYAWGDYANMAACSEGGPHAWGHNGVGGAMADMFASPGDPVFWLHHAFIDRNFRVWQNSHGVSNMNGNDVTGTPLNFGMSVNVYDIRRTVMIGDIMDTTDPTLCYKYNY